jgi:hypothetical protein
MSKSEKSSLPVRVFIFSRLTESVTSRRERKFTDRKDMSLSILHSRHGTS